MVRFFCEEYCTQSIVVFVLKLVCVTPAYLLFERGRMGMGVVVFFVGMVVAAVAVV
jgi:hypothetical protein